MVLMFMFIAFIVHAKGINALDKPHQPSTSLKYILDEPVLYPSITRKLAQDKIKIDIIAYLSRRSIELFKSLVIVDDWPQNDQATMDAWKYMKLLKGRSKCLYINAYNKNDRKKLHLTMHTTEHFLLRMNFSNVPAKTLHDLMDWSHIPSFITSLTGVYDTRYMGEDRYVNIDLTSFDPSCKLQALIIRFMNGWIDLPDYSFPSSLKRLEIKSDIMLYKKQTDYQRLWNIGSHIEELYIYGMRVELSDFTGFENMIHLKMMHVEGFGREKAVRLDVLLQKLFQNSQRADPILVFSHGENYQKVMYFNRSRDTTLTINGNGTRFTNASESIMSAAFLWFI
eukprot:1008597_1